MLAFIEGRESFARHTRSPSQAANKYTPLKNKKPSKTRGQENGAGDEIRTHDIHLGKVALYH